MRRGPPSRPRASASRTLIGTVDEGRPSWSTRVYRLVAIYGPTESVKTIEVLTMTPSGVGMAFHLAREFTSWGAGGMTMLSGDLIDGHR